MKVRKVTQKDLLLARRIKRLRKQSGLTQEQVATKTGLSVTFIGLLETARRRPSLKSLQKIASTIKVKVKDLISF